MNLYLTYEDKEKLRKAFLNLRKQYVIDSVEIISSLGYDHQNMSEYSKFIINEKIRKTIQTVSASSKVQSIIYTNPLMDHEVIRAMINFAQQETTIEKVILLTDRGKKEELYELFQEVVYFPAIKRVHILKCEPFHQMDETIFEDS